MKLQRHFITATVEKLEGLVLAKKAQSKGKQKKPKSAKKASRDAELLNLFKKIKKADFKVALFARCPDGPIDIPPINTLTYTDPGCFGC